VLVANGVSVLVLALVLGACATTPPPTVKPEDMPKAYQAPTPDTDKQVTAEWWKSFASSELGAFVTEAHSGNLDLATAAARLQQAQAEAGSATASLFPSIDATAVAKVLRARLSSSGSGTARQYSLSP